MLFRNAKSRAAMIIMKSDDTGERIGAVVQDIILCERGILPLGKGKSYTRYTLDLAAVPVMQKETFLPVIVDPSHAAGRRDLIFSLSCASIAAGACGLIVEVHHNPAEALVDAAQQITPDEFKELVTAWPPRGARRRLPGRLGPTTVKLAATARIPAGMPHWPVSVKVRAFAAPLPMAGPPIGTPLVTRVSMRRQGLRVK